MDANEEYVRAKWINADVNLGDFNRNLYPAQMDDWQAAREFTEARLREVAEVDEEIELQRLVGNLGWVGMEWGEVSERTLSRLQAIRNEMVKGMTPAGGKEQA